MKRRNVILFTIISFIVAAIVSMVYVFYMQTLVKTKTQSNIALTTKESASYIDEFIDKNYVLIENDIENLALSKDETAKKIMEDFSTYNLYGAGYFDDETNAYTYFTKDGNQASSTFNYYYISKAKTISQKVSFIKEKYLLNNESENDAILYTFNVNSNNYFVMQDASFINDLMMNPYAGNDAYYLFAAKDGFVCNTNYEAGQSSTLIQLFNFEDDVESFVSTCNEEKVIVKSLGNASYYVTEVNLNTKYNSNGMMLFGIVSTTYVNGITNIVLFSTLIFVGVLIVLLLAYAVFTFIQLTLVRSRFGKEGLFIKDENHYSALLDRNGRVVSKNAKFTSLGLRLSGPLAKNIDIVELNGDSDKFIDLLQENNEFTAHTQNMEGKDVDIHFIVIKNNIGYQIIGTEGSFKKASKEINDIEHGPTNKNPNGIIHDFGDVDIKNLYRDDLYDIYNKKALYIEIKKIINEQAENNKKTYLFYFGNAGEEEVIRTYGKQIEEFLNISLIDTVQKIFGEDVLIYNIDDHHFAFLYDLADTFQTLGKLMEKVADAMKKPTIVFSNEIEAQIDFGIYHFASFNLEGTAPQKLLDKAALSFEHAVGLTNKIYKLYDDNLEIAFSMDDIIANDIRNGLKNNEFVAYYQPNYSLKEDKVSGFECLLRWNNDKYRHDSPYRYIQVAEKVGLINDIGYFTLIESFKLMKELNDPSLHISVNVSPAQFLQPGFIARLVSLYTLFEVPYQCICVEITETFLIQSMAEVIEKLKYLRSFGIKIYLDDFGTGYSSLKYLAELPVDVIKIDKEFITPLKTSKSARVIVSELIQIANDLDIDIVAEGVEDEYQVQFLEKKKCNNIQGYFFSMPVAKEEAKEALKIKRVKK